MDDQRPRSRLHPQLSKWLDEIDACKSARLWIAQQSDQSPRASVLACPRGDWLLYAGEHLNLLRKDLVLAVRPAVLRTVREYAPTRLDVVGLIEDAERLRSLPDDVPFGTAAEVAWTVWSSAWPTWQAAKTMEKVAAWTAVMTAKLAAEAAEVESMTNTPTKASLCASTAAPDQEAEHRRCADEVRAAIGERLIKALEEQIGGGR